MLSLFTVAGLVLFARAQETPPVAPERLALLVGIDRYPEDGGFDDLGGAVRDTLALRDVLVRRFAFRTEDVLLLHDAAATHAAIVQAFDQHLLRRAGGTTEVVFYFAGHGSRVPDLSRGEPDGLDSTYVAHDSRAGGLQGARDLCDDELFSLVAALCAKTPKVTVIADSCHAGGGLRLGFGERARSVPGSQPLDREWLKSFWPADVPLLDDDAPALSGERHLHVAACRRDQLAGETLVAVPEGEPVWRGRMSLYLVQALSAAKPGETWRAVLARTQRAVSAEIASQSVLVEGAADRVLFGDTFVRRIGLSAVPLAGQKAVRVELVVPHALRPGSRLELRAGERRIGEAQVDDVGAQYARARWLGPPPEKLSEAELIAIPLGPPAGTTPFALRVAPELAALGRELASPRLRLVGADERCDAELALSGEDLVLRTEEGLPLLVRRRDEPGLATLLRTELEEELHWRFLSGLGREASTYPIEASFRIPTAAEVEHAKWGKNQVPATLRESGRARAAGGELRVVGIPVDQSPAPIVLLELENPHEHPLWVAVLSISEDRGRHAMRFEDSSTLRRLAPGEKARVPCRVVLPASWPLARPMRDRYLVLSLEREFDPSVHERQPSLRGMGDEGGLDVKLPPALLPPSRLGRGEAVPAPYGVVALDLLVEPPTK